MIKYAKIINSETGLCEVGLGTNKNFYKSIGMKKEYVEQSEIDGQWYLESKCPHYTPEEKKEREDKEFNAQFFNTSLGYVRRKVSMKDGTTRDFLTDILPLLEVGVPILTYSRELEQSKVQVTEEFLNECKQQLLTDFYGG